MPCACCPDVFENSCVLVVGTVCYLACVLCISEQMQHLKALLLEGKRVNWKIEEANHVFSVELGKTGENNLFLF